MRKLRLVLGFIVWATLVPGWAGAAGSQGVIEVFPGQNAIQLALDGAQPGDVLNIHLGTYPESFAVAVTGVTLRAAGDGDVIVDGGCVAAGGIHVTAEAA